MIDNLIKRLRAITPALKIAHEAADALAAQQQRIVELEREQRFLIAEREAVMEVAGHSPVQSNPLCDTVARKIAAERERAEANEKDAKCYLDNWRATEKAYNELDKRFADEADRANKLRQRALDAENALAISHERAEGYKRRLQAAP